MAALNKAQFDIQDVPAHQLQEGDQLVGLFGKTYPVTGVKLNEGGTTTVTSAAHSRPITVKNSLTHTIIKRR